MVELVKGVAWKKRSLILYEFIYGESFFPMTFFIIDLFIRDDNEMTINSPILFFIVKSMFVWFDLVVYGYIGFSFVSLKGHK